MHEVVNWLRLEVYSSKTTLNTNFLNSINNGDDNDDDVTDDDDDDDDDDDNDGYGSHDNDCNDESVSKCFPNHSKHDEVSEEKEWRKVLTGGRTEGARDWVEAGGLWNNKNVKKL